MNKNIVVALCLLLVGCQDAVDTKVTKGEYQVGYYIGDSTREHADRLVSYLESSNSVYKSVRLIRNTSSAHSYRLDVEGRVNSSLPAEEQSRLASVIAKGFSTRVFNGDSCTIYIQPSVGYGGKVQTSGTSFDPRVE